MSGKCTDNPRIGIVGCGQTYGGETQHCVADVPWSTYPDGKAHITGRLSTIEKCWVAPSKGARAALVDPSTIEGLRLDDKGVYRQNVEGDHWATAVEDDTMWRCSDKAPHDPHMMLNAVQSFCAGVSSSGGDT